ncbi:hypothetical protein BDA99DRAFT_528743 [Phascolomyces articulosus]|uniref:PSP proline-rich domain-containing protein n=1 Tax=Phascolomyces articulosus TaxID=60185 RepID=A0AAD5JLC7_9FUNG|nr:hypothetical protein BDA99DRAFT_528743 [Phascolomyces articulosus]
MATKDNNSTERIKALKQKRRAKKKARKHRKDATLQNETIQEDDPPLSNSQHDEIIENDPFHVDQSILQYFSRVLDHFDVPTVKETTTVPSTYKRKDDDEKVEEDDVTLPISRKQLKRLTRLTVEELKQLADIPEVVEPWDVDATDPKLLVSLKSYRNTIPVPRHWCQQRPYLQRRKERVPWELPEFIKQTGIAEIRDAIKEKEVEARRSAKRRARLNPKLGKMDLDYQKLHDAFYRFQTKPRLTGHGDLYYEGKENVNQFKPGKISTTLQEALDSIEPPPWLFGMQRYGPPPSYPQLELPGVNAPIPKGAEWGYKSGQWGHPPVDEFNRPLYGDVFGVQQSQDNQELSFLEGIDVDRSLWGELEPEEGDQMEYKDDNNTENEDDDFRFSETQDDEYLTEIQVPEIIELRKTKKKEDDTGIDGSHGGELYQVLPQIPQSVSSKLYEFMPSQNTYRFTTTQRRSNTFVNQDVNVTIDDPSQLEQKSTLQAKYEEAQQERQPKHEDLSDMYLEHANRQAKKLEKREQHKMMRQKDI